jgi:hypothetical protein
MTRRRTLRGYALARHDGGVALEYYAPGHDRARGIFGQQIFIDPRSNVVITAHSNALTAVGSRYHKHLEAVVPALAAAMVQQR